MHIIKRTVSCRIALLSALLLVPLLAHAAGTVTVVRAGKNAVTLQASGLEAPCGIDITLKYDSARLANPSVAQGSATSGAVFITNTNVLGQVRLAIVKTTPMDGSGPIATVTFDRAVTSLSLVKITNMQVIDQATTNLSATIGDSIDNVTQSTGGGTPPPADLPPTVITTPGTGGGAPFVVGGTLTMPNDDSASRDRKDVPGQGQPQTAPQQESRDVAVPAAPAPATETPVASESQPAPKQEQKEAPRAVPSVLEKFRLYSGEKTPQKLAALFDRDPAANFSQTPPILIADGKASVKVTISKVTGERAPNFSFTQAHRPSLKQTGDGDWLVEVVPDKGALKASISMLVDGVQQEIPLTVAPQADLDLDGSGTVNLADWQFFLKTTGTEAAPRFDLNKDGKRDYKDDYIFAANYLALKGTKDLKDVPAQKKQP
jgi:hypothetical protein